MLEPKEPPNNVEMSATSSRCALPASPIAIRTSGATFAAPSYGQECLTREGFRFQTKSNSFQIDHGPPQPEPTPTPHLANSATTQHPAVADSVHARLPGADSNFKKASHKKSPNPERGADHRLSRARRTLSKQAAVPEESLVLLTFDTNPAPKRRRTEVQRENKRMVMEAGGSCLLCLLTKKRVLSPYSLSQIFAWFPAD